MKTRILVSIWAMAAVLLSGAVSAQGAAAGWQDFSTSEGRFKVSLPGSPEYRADQVKVQEGSAVQHFYTAKHGGNAYIVTYADYPAGYVQRLGTSQVLDTDRDNFVKGMKGQLGEERRYKIDGWSGREFRFTGPDGLSGICSAYLVGYRVYMLCAVTRSGGSLRDMQQFQESFRLLRQSRR